MTPARKSISPEFLHFFYEFSLHNDVYLVTGSDREKTLEQVTPGIYNLSKRVYNCSGSDVYEGDLNVYRDDWELPKDVERHLENELLFSKFPVRNGIHIEHRPGGVNFSILGRGKDPSDGRKEYIEWDKERLEREDIAERIRNQFPDLSVALGGQTGLDIGPLGSDKSQILRDFSKDDEIHFFGDRIEKGGNDHTLAMGIVNNMMGCAYNVKDWKETRTKLIELTD